ncbi:MFS transporter [Streptomyces palmae]|uniref:MFS transporter n=1 Tax=Streptomyces palmae TaxID=1701085 RepID=A0A4Z0GKZ7_9ACTN|nr:MFS transporter [Streptomyces palmae]
MLAVALIDRIGSGLWAATAVLYFTYVADLSAARIGLLLAVSGAVGVAGPPIAGHLADRVRLRPLMVGVQAIRAAASLALLTTTELAPLCAVAAAGSLGDRASSVLTKLYATRMAGPERTRYQAINRTVANLGWALGGLAAAAALAAGNPAVYRALLIGDALSYVLAALITLRCQEPEAPSRVVARGPDPGDTAACAAEPATAPPSPWRDRGYLLYTATDAVLFLDDSIFKMGLTLWLVTGTSAPHGLAPLLLVLNNVLVVLLQVPCARFGADPAAARRALLPLGGIFLAGGAALALSALPAPWVASTALILAATAFTLAEILHSTISWELSVALAPSRAQGAYLGVHSLGQASQRSVGPLAVTAAMAVGPVGWLGFGAAIAAVCCLQRHLVERRPAAPLSVPAVTVSEH